MLRYKKDVLQALLDAGYSSYRLRNEKLLSERAMQQIRKGEVIGIISLEKICGLLNCQPGDLIEYVKDQ